MTTLQERVVDAARDWIGTRFHHQGRLKKTDAHKGGVDCLGLLVGVASELHLKDKAGIPIISHDNVIYTHAPDVHRLRNTLEAILVSIPHGDMRAGDVILMNIDGQPQHLGIVSNNNSGVGIIHAFAPARAVVEHALDGFWHERIIAVFRLSSLNN